VPAVEPGRVPVVVVEHGGHDLLHYDQYFRDSRYQAVPARNLSEARRLIDRLRPVAIVLDIRLGGDAAGAFIGELRRGPDTAATPVVVVSASDDQGKGLAAGASVPAIKPVHPTWLLGTLDRLLDRGGDRRVLVIDDDEIARYLVRTQLAGAPFLVREAVGPAEGLRAARAERPDVIVLDLVMPEMSGFDVLARLKEDPATTDIPVVVLTSKALTDEERSWLAPHALRILSKEALALGEAAEDLRVALSSGVRPGEVPP
jgi:CheY-like chemotaxis protein